MLKSSFFEFNVARSALFTAQANMQVTSHNIANASTRGYSRQYGVTVASNPMRGYGTGMYGTGSEVTTVKRHRNEFLDRKYWDQNSMLGNYDTKVPHLQELERAFSTVDVDGTKNVIMERISELEKTFSDLATNAHDLTFRDNVINSTESFITAIATIGKQLTEQQQLINEEIVITVNQMNNIAGQVARLNEQIRTSEFTGDVANDLRDERTRLLDQLSGFVNLEIKETQVNPDYNPLDPNTTPPSYELSVFIDGTLFIQGKHVNELSLTNRDDNVDAAGNPDPIKKNPHDGPGLYDITFGVSKTKFPMYSSSLQGSLKALIDIRDGNNARGLSYTQGQDANGEYYGTSGYGEDYYRTTGFKGIPHYIDRINELVRTFARAVNEGKDHNGNPMEDVVGHANGYDLEGNTGRFFFTMYDANGNAINDVYDTNYSALTAAEKDALYANMDWNNIAINTELSNNPKLIATSSVFGSGESDNLVSLGFSNILDDDNLFATGKMNDYVIGISSEAAISTKHSMNFTKNYEDIVNVADNQRIAVHGVDLNEEMTNMVKYQQMYQAASKMISVIDSIYDTTINRLI